MTSILSLDDISCLDRQIEELNDYKPIPEHEVKALCEKVSLTCSKHHRLDHHSSKGCTQNKRSMLQHLIKS